MAWSLFGALSPKAPLAIENFSTIDRLTYAIGDVHGRYDLFMKMIETIKADSEAHGEKPRIVLLGDYIDRGPASAQVLQAIRALCREDWCDTEVLLGNHEVFMMRFVLDPAQGAAWLNYGGMSTLASYGINMPVDRTDPERWKELAAEMIVKIPREDMDILCDAKIYLIAGNYLFVHGGVRPGVAVEEQTADTLLWIRDEFLNSPKASDYVVVHGHSAKATADNLPWRIGIDTGAYATGILSAVRLTKTSRDILQVRLGGASLGARASAL